MEVKIINKTNNIVDTLYASARTCYSELGPIDIDCNIPEDKKINLINKVLQSGHTSVSEHANFTFAIQGISRACLAQLTRHRMASFSVKSQRYVEIKEDKTFLEDLLVTGDKSKVAETAKKYFVLDWVRESDLYYIGRSMLESILIYLDMIDLEYKPEDARMFLPNAFKTDLTITINLRSLMNLCNERLCTRAQKEIRTLVNKMVEAVCEEDGWLKQYLVPKCEKLHYCPEHKCCGRKKSISEVIGV